MYKLFLSLALLSFSSVSAVHVEGVSEFAISGPLQESDRALGVEFAKQDALNQLRVQLQLGLELDSVYIASPAVERFNVDSQQVKSCGPKTCLATTVSAFAQEAILNSIKERIDSSLSSMESRLVSTDDVRLSLEIQLALLSQRYRALMQSTDIAQAIHAQWMVLAADEKHYELRKSAAKNIQKPSMLLHELNGISWRSPSVSLMDNKEYTVQEFHVNNGEPEFGDIWQYGIANDPINHHPAGLIRDTEINVTRFRLPSHPSAKPLVIKAQYDCFTYSSPKQYRDDLSVRQFVLFNNDIEIMIGDIAIGRGYVTKKESNLDKTKSADPVPRLCYINRVELYKPKSLDALQLSMSLGITVRDVEGVYIGRTKLNRYSPNSRYSEVLETEELAMWQIFEPSQQALKFDRLDRWYNESYQKMVQSSLCLDDKTKNEMVTSDDWFAPPVILNKHNCPEVANLPRYSEGLGLGFLHNALLHNISKEPLAQLQPVGSDFTGIRKPYSYPSNPVRVNEYQLEDGFGYMNGRSTTYWMNAQLLKGVKK
ncbi:hypothetical protein ACRZ5S_23000 (plasmid) [Vibrio scophthalmi]|uniref:hypothetical protein n=1 Tax=Vibrio scophthalmi TaxID=45658 RepID=UPI003EB6B71C